MKNYILGFLLFLIAYDFQASALADEEFYPISQSTYGGIGLIQTPTARFSDDGEFLFGASTEGPWNRLFAKMQFFPWMEAVLRYTEGEYKPYQRGMIQTWKDKGLDFKFKLLEESNTFPSLAVGFLDLGGTGAYSSEYIVESKRYNNFDFTIGMGWGRYGGVDHINNPLGWFSDEKKDRRYDIIYGGTISVDRFFAAEYASIFGGMEYHTPFPNLSLKVEYDSSDYSDVEGKESVLNEVGDIFNLDSRVNFSLNYRMNMSSRDKVDISFGYNRGNTLYTNIAVHSNLNFSGKKKYSAPKEILNTPYLEPFDELDKEWKNYLSDLIFWQMGNEGITPHSLIFDGDEVQVEISQGRFKEPVLAIDLASRILGNNSPKNINNITVINFDSGIETVRASISRSDLVSSVANGPLDESLLVFNKYKPLSDNAIKRDNKRLYPNFYWELKPHAMGTLQHQVKFYFWQIEALLHTEFAFTKGLYLTTDIGVDIANNYDEYTYHVPDGELYHVRQDRRLYLTQGETGLRRMAIDYITSLHPNIKAKFSAGYLEWMYGGVGGEILYIPDNKSWALGIDAYWVKQRDFDQKFSFLDYETTTGFITYYQDIPFYDMRLKLSAGKFLAKDKGVHIDISRRFKTGARIGGIIALTDCDASCVGEGSFNKWIYFDLPMDLFYSKSSTRGRGGYMWSPLTKDAGSKVEAGNLYNAVISAEDEIESLRTKSFSIKKIFKGFSLTPKQQI